MSKTKHVFEDKSFKKPTPCDLCNDAIWGFGKNKRCVNCKKCFHKKCTAMKLEPCPGKAAKAAPDPSLMGKRGSMVSITGEVVDLKQDNDVLHRRVLKAVEDNELESLRKFLQNKKVIKPMLTMIDGQGQTPLTLAVSKGDPAVVEALLDVMTAAEVNHKDAYEATPLHIACSQTATKNDRVLEQLLAIDGIDVCALNKDKNTPLHYFCEKYATVNCAELGGKLLSLGGLPLVLQQNVQGETALHKAMLNQQFRLPMARFLIRATTDHRPVDDKADDNDKRKEPEVAVSAEAGAKFINLQNTKGETALHYGVRMERSDVVQLLLGAGADISVENKAGQTASQLADSLQKQKHKNGTATVGSGLMGIIILLDQATWLRDWLDRPELNMKRYVRYFMAAKIGKDELTALKDHNLADMGISVMGDRLRLMKEIKALKKKIKKSKEKDKKKSLKREKKKKRDDLTESGAPNIRTQLEKLQYIKVDAGDWIDGKDLEFLEELGSGASGIVMKGIYTHPSDGSVHDVAIKVLKEAQSDKEIEEFKKEFQILSAVQSPYMVHFFGAQLEPKLCMIMELCTKGSLWDVLNDKSLTIGWDQMLEWSLQLCEGVAALHANDPQIVHRDLKTLNLLMTEAWVIKICDFGLSRFSTTSNLETLAKMRGTMAYCPPEAYFGKPFTDVSDVYSVAVILWELLMRTIKGVYFRPFYEYPNMKLDFQIIIQVARKGKRPTLPDTTPEALKSLIERSWASEPEKRPTAKAAADEVRAMQAAYTADSTPWNAVYEGEAKAAHEKSTSKGSDNDDDDDDDDEEEEESEESESEEEEAEEEEADAADNDAAEASPEKEKKTPRKTPRSSPALETAESSTSKRISRSGSSRLKGEKKSTSERKTKSKKKDHKSTRDKRNLAKSSAI